MPVKRTREQIEEGLWELGEELYALYERMGALYEDIVNLALGDEDDPTDIPEGKKLTEEQIANKVV